MQKDPFLALQDTLAVVFQLEATRKDNYAFPPVQSLKEAMDAYNPEEKLSFIKLVKAVIKAHAFIEKRVQFEEIQNHLNKLTKNHSLAAINWDRILPGARSRFQLSTPEEEPLTTWLTTKCQRDFNELKYFEKIQVLVDHCNHNGFSQKLSMHLKEAPDFLFDLISKSDRCFIKICSSRLNLYLTDVQIATAILLHLPKLIQPQEDPFLEVKQLIETLNSTLSNGRSVTTLLRNTEAKPILDQSVLFQIYQSKDYQEKDEKNPGLS